MSLLIHWFERLLFGNDSPSDTPPPRELKNLILRMEVENIPWFHMMQHGGLTAFAYQVHGDLNSLTDYLEKQWVEQLPHYEPGPFKTRAVSRFWDDLQLLLAKRDEETILPIEPPCQRDDVILQHFLEGDRTNRYDYQSASFWGETARRFINLRRPETVATLPPVSESHFQRILRLYDIFCKARGQIYEPFTLHLVPGAEHVNAAHWQTDQNLEAFMRDRPSHSLSLSVQALLRRTLHQLLHGEKPSALLNPCPRLDALLHNIRVIHESVQQVPHANTPPRLIDVLQRLLALCERDGLWEKNVPEIPAETRLVGTSLLHLTEQVRIAERERRVLWKHAINSSEFVPEPRERICDDYLYASDKYRYSSSFAGLERRNVLR